MCCQLPRRTDSNSDIQGNGEHDRRRHLLSNEGFDSLLFTGCDLEEEFVVDLHEEARGQVGLEQGGGDIHHGDLDNIGGTALDRRVEGGAFGHLSALAVGGAQVGQVASATEHGLRVAVGASLGDESFEIVADLAEALE